MNNGPRFISNDKSKIHMRLKICFSPETPAHFQSNFKTNHTWNKGNQYIYNEGL